VASRTVRVAIVNDYELVVAGLAAVLAQFTHRIGVVELDAQMPVISDVDVVLYDSFARAQGDTIDNGMLTREGASAKLVIFSWNVQEELVTRAIRAGAAGYLHKGIEAEQLVSALEAVHAGEQVLPGSSSADRLGRWPGDDFGLSPRESEVLALICQGLSNQEIAHRAFLGVNTIKTYIRTAYRKIGVTSRTNAVLWGVEHGFTPDRARAFFDA
jgi:NarL family two-component system response regulator LiaR